MFKMFNRFFFGILLVSGAAYADDFAWPDHQVPVRLNGQNIDVHWKDGRPMVFREKTLHLFHVRTGPEEFDLAEFMQAKGYKLTLNSDGSIDAEKTLTGGTFNGNQGGVYYRSQSTGVYTRPPYHGTSAGNSQPSHTSNSQQGGPPRTFYTGVSDKRDLGKMPKPNQSMHYKPASPLDTTKLPGNYPGSL